MAVFNSKLKWERAERPARLRVTDAPVWQPLVEAQRLFLFLDLDGTLVEIAATPDNVSLDSERRGCLEKLAATPGVSVAVVSGRRVEELQAIVGLRGIFYVGLHGLATVTPQGERISYPVGSEVIAALQSLREELRSSCGGISGIFLEDKGLTLALHFRLAGRERVSKILEDFVQRVRACRERGVPLEMLEGKEVLEVKPTAMNKGKAVLSLLEQFGKGALPVCLGDDVTDETAFQSLKEKGITILVAEKPRPTAAASYLRDPNEVFAFLKELILRRDGKS